MKEPFMLFFHDAYQYTQCRHQYKVHRYIVFLFLFVFFSSPLSLSLSLSVCLFPYLSLSVSLSVYLSVTFCLARSLSFALFRARALFLSSPSHTIIENTHTTHLPNHMKLTAILTTTKMSTICLASSRAKSNRRLDAFESWWVES